MPRRYSKAEKAHAVGQALATNTLAAAESLGIPRTTLRQWLGDPAYDELRHKTRDVVADELWASIQLGIREVARGITGDAPLRDKVVAFGILYDKHALLTGAATSRSESRDLTGTLSDPELIAALREAEHLARGDGAPAPSAGPPEGEGV